MGLERSEVTGEEHRQEAERLLKPTVRYYNGGQTEVLRDPSEDAIARAQAHATLALLAVIAERP